MASYSFTLRGFARASRSLRLTFVLKSRMLQNRPPAAAPSESVDHGDSELILKQLHTLRTKPGAAALAAPISARWCRISSKDGVT